MELEPYEANAQWLEWLQSDPENLRSAVYGWWQIAADCEYEMRCGDRPDIPKGFGKLTSLLVLWCDTNGITNPEPLQEYSRQLYARKIKPQGSGRPLHWQPFKVMKTTLTDAIGLCQRIAIVAESKPRQKPPKDGPTVDGICIDGKLHPIRQPLTLRLVSALWKRPDRQMTYDEASSEVWRDSEKIVTEGMAKRQQKNANESLAGSLLSISISNGVFSLRDDRQPR